MLKIQHFNQINQHNTFNQTEAYNLFLKKIASKYQRNFTSMPQKSDSSNITKKKKKTSKPEEISMKKPKKRDRNNERREKNPNLRDGSLLRVFSAFWTPGASSLSAFWGSAPLLSLLTSHPRFFSLFLIFFCYFGRTTFRSQMGLIIGPRST